MLQGVDELDPSGRLGAKVQRLSELTKGMQLARSSNQPFFNGVQQPSELDSSLPQVGFFE